MVVLAIVLFVSIMLGAAALVARSYATNEKAKARSMAEANPLLRDSDVDRMWRAAVKRAAERW